MGEKEKNGVCMNLGLMLVCVCLNERDALKDVDTMCRGVSHWTFVRLREYGE